jgi:hypothetical protein
MIVAIRDNFVAFVLCLLEGGIIGEVGGFAPAGIIVVFAGETRQGKDRREEQRGEPEEKPMIFFMHGKLLSDPGNKDRPGISTKI